PDVLIQSGARLKEVGTTNRTYLEDFEKAIDENTGALLSVHASNFKIVGFTHAPTIKELSELGQNKEIPVLHDIGSGCLLDPSKFGLTEEPVPRHSISEGADLCFFSGDKLIGGPQSGIIVGKKRYVSQLADHPLARAFRIDKMNLAALNATLIHYIRDEAEEKIPIWRMLSATKHQLLKRAQILRDRLGGLLTIEETRSAIGGGSFPGFDIDSVGLVFDNGSPDAMGAKMRKSETPVVCRIEDDRLIFDLRTVLSEEDDALVRAILQNVND
ncbi:MAG: L-seryl-tRNA(Sec) selenium transferase, partial [Chloroflexota bacterium]|nr:L-seryl-tRNA(Sec) selenium transferase [Chloroflexota bacterium]